MRGVRVRRFHQRYLSYPVEGDQQKLPLLHVRLIGNQGSLRTIALIDSGATVTFIPPELAEAIDLRPQQKGVPAIGAGGEFLNDICTFRLEILKGKEVVHRISGEAHVPQDAERIPYVVLGRDYLFQDFDVTFREKRELVVLKPASGRD
jgi:predicted aspartyl protease